MLRQLVNFEQKKYKNNIHTDKKNHFICIKVKLLQLVKVYIGPTFLKQN